MHLAAHLAASIAVLSTGVVYGRSLRPGRTGRTARRIRNRRGSARAAGRVGAALPARQRRSTAHSPPPTTSTRHRPTRALQHDWDRIITPRAVLQGLAIAALCVSLIN
jgi:hypothetical protein